MPKIFLSHNSADKPLVEPIAIRLAEIFGRESVFYDKWSIQPGDGIIQRMNDGLEAPDFFFFFVSRKSLDSKMVEIEWQNALFRATKGVTKIIPVRIDDAPFPAILSQNLYVDMYGSGLEVALHQIVSVCQGANTFTPHHEDFQNLTWSLVKISDHEFEAIVSASHLLEVNLDFLILTKLSQEQLSVSLSGSGIHRGGYNPNLDFSGEAWNGFAIAPMGGGIKPGFPLRLRLKLVPSHDLGTIVLLHKTKENFYEPLRPTV